MCYNRPMARYCTKGALLRVSRTAAPIMRARRSGARAALRSARGAHMVLSAFEYHALPGP